MLFDVCCSQSLWRRSAASFWSYFTCAETYGLMCDTLKSSLTGREALPQWKNNSHVLERQPTTLTVLALLQQWEGDKVTVNSLAPQDRYDYEKHYRNSARDLPVESGALIKKPASAKRRKTLTWKQNLTEMDFIGGFPNYRAAFLLCGVCRRSDAALCLQSAVTFLSQLGPSSGRDEDVRLLRLCTTERRESVALTSVERLERLSVCIKTRRERLQRRERPDVTTGTSQSDSRLVTDSSSSQSPAVSLAPLWQTAHFRWLLNASEGSAVSTDFCLDDGGI